jgi:hypothetical protein
MHSLLPGREYLISVPPKRNHTCVHFQSWGKVSGPLFLTGTEWAGDSLLQDTLSTSLSLLH